MSVPSRIHRPAINDSGPSCAPQRNKRRKHCPGKATNPLQRAAKSDVIARRINEQNSDMLADVGFGAVSGC